MRPLYRIVAFEYLDIDGRPHTGGPMRHWYLVATLFAALPLPLHADTPSGDVSKGVALPSDGLAGRAAEVAKAVTAAPARAMKGSGLAGAAGGVHLRVLS